MTHKPITSYQSGDGDEILKISRHGFGWAEIYLGSRGQFMAISDYGNYGYVWSSVGGDPSQSYLEHFCRFLIGVESSPTYFAEKLDPRRVYDPKSTVSFIKEHILSMRKDGTWGENETNEELGLLKELDSLSSSSLFETWIRDTRIEAPAEFYATQLTGQVLAFVDEIMIKFMAPLLKEAYRDQKS